MSINPEVNFVLRARNAEFVGPVRDSTKATDTLKTSTDTLAKSQQSGAGAATTLALASARLAKETANAEVAALRAAIGETKLGEAQSRAAREAVALTLAQQKLAQAQDRLRDSAGKMINSDAQLRASKLSLGQQFSDFGTQILSGGNVFTAFAQQSGQAAFALQGFNGTLGKVGAFLNGPWGIATTLAISALGIMAGKFLETGDNAKEAGKGLEDFQKRQSDIGNFIDATTGRLIEQNKTLLQNAVLTRQAAIDKNKAAITDSSRNAFVAARNVLGDDTPIYTAGGVTQPRVDPALQAVIRSANGDVAKLDAGLQSLAKRRPDLKAVILDVSNAAGEAITLQRENAKLGTEIDKLTGKTLAQGLGTAGLIDKQVALATATTRLEKAQAQYNLVQAQAPTGAAATTRALEEYRGKLTAAANAVNSAEVAQRAFTTARRDDTKATRDATKEENTLAAAFKSTLRELDPAANALREYGDQLDRIAKLEKAKKLTPIEGMKLRDAANQALQAAQLKDLVSKESDAFKQLVSGPFELTGEAMKNQLADIVKSTGKEIEQVLPRSLSSALGDTLEALGAILPGRVGGKLSGVARAIGSVGNVEQVEKLTSGISGLAKGVGFSNEIATKFGASLGQFLPVYAAGMAIAKPISGLLSSIGIKQSGTGLALGGLVGATIGGLFKSTKKASATLGNVDGSASVTGTAGNSASYRNNASALGGNVGSALNTLVDTLGGTLGDFAVSIGQRKGKFVVDPTGAGRTKGSGTQSFKDQSEAESAALRDAIADGAIKGLSAAVETAIRSSTDVDVALKEALKVQAVEDLIGGLGATLSREFKTFEQQAAERVRIAQKYGFDLVKLEEINAQDRADIFNNTMEQRVGSLKTLLSDLKFGDLFEGSAAEQRNAILKEIDAARIDAEAGKTGAADKVASLTKQLLGVSKDAFGTAGPEYATDRTTAQSTAERIIELETARIQKAADDAKATSDATKATAAGVDETNDLLAMTNAKLDAITASLQSLSLVGVAGGGSLANFRVARV